MNEADVVENTITLRVDRLRKAREELGWSQRELARRAGVNDTLVSRYENGLSEPSATNVRLIAEALRLSIDYLLGLSDEPRGHFGEGQLNADEQAMVDAYRLEGWAGVARLIAVQLEK